MGSSASVARQIMITYNGTQIIISYHTTAMIITTKDGTNAVAITPANWRVIVKATN